MFKQRFLSEKLKVKKRSAKTLIFVIIFLFPWSIKLTNMGLHINCRFTYYGNIILNTKFKTKKV